MFSDASDIAAGAFTVENNEKVFYKAWSKHECAQSSTWRELKAIQLALESYACSFENFFILLTRSGFLILLIDLIQS